MEARRIIVEAARQLLVALELLAEPAEDDGERVDVSLLVQIAEMLGEASKAPAAM